MPHRALKEQNLFIFFSDPLKPVPFKHLFIGGPMQKIVACNLFLNSPQAYYLIFEMLLIKPPNGHRFDRWEKRKSFKGKDNTNIKDHFLYTGDYGFYNPGYHH